MASPLERLDQLRNAFTNRGISGSNLASQSIRRQNLPTLGKELATSQSTRQSQAQSRRSASRSRAIRDRSQNLQALRNNRGQRGGSSGISPSVISTVGNNAIGGGGRRFQIQSSSGIETFNTLDELKLFLKANPDTARGTSILGTPGLGSQFLNQAERKALGLPNVDFIKGQRSIGQTAGLETFQRLVQQSGGTQEPVGPDTSEQGVRSELEKRLKRTVGLAELRARQRKLGG